MVQQNGPLVPLLQWNSNMRLRSIKGSLSGRTDHCSSQSFQNISLLCWHLLWKSNYAAITFYCTCQSNADTSISRSGFNNSVSRFQHSSFLGIQDHSLSNTILDKWMNTLTEPPIFMNSHLARISQLMPSLGPNLLMRIMGVLPMASRTSSKIFLGCGLKGSWTCGEFYILSPSFQVHLCVSLVVSITNLNVIRVW